MKEPLSFFITRALRRHLFFPRDFSLSKVLSLKWPLRSTHCVIYLWGMQNPLLAFEDHLMRSAAETSRLLGVSYTHYCAMRSGKRPIPDYLQYSVEAHTALPMDRLLAIWKERRNAS